MSKYILAGEPVASFIKRGGIGCWVVRTQEDSNKLQRMIAVASLRADKKATYKTMSCIYENNKHAEVRYCLTAILEE